MMAQRRVTDRAERYRANKLLSVKGKSCLLCGSTRNLVPDHWDGHPDHTNPGNLEVLCKSCNTSKGAAFAKAGRGRLTHQYNPTKGGGAATIGEWMQAVGAITPHVDRGDRGLVSTMSTRDAVDMIRATPQSKRRDFAAKLRRKNPIFGAGRPRLFGTPFVAPAGGVGPSYVPPQPKAPKRIVKAKPTKAVAAKADYWGGSGEWPSEQIFQEGFQQGMTAREIIAANPALQRLRKLNPAKFDRCVKAVQAKRNPAAGAAEVFEEFHGFPSSEIVTVSKKVHHHAHLAALGTLVELDVWGVDGIGHKIKGFKDALLACNETRDQLFVEGGDQRINLKDFGIRKPHETETLGRVTNIGYRTNKTHLGDEGGNAVYVHRFRAINKAGKHVVVKMTREPDLIYDVRNEQLLFSGGSYEILREGINQ
jgi:hypothetical protein